MNSYKSSKSHEHITYVRVKTVKLMFPDIWTLFIGRPDEIQNWLFVSNVFLVTKFYNGMNIIMTKSQKRLSDIC